MDNASLTTTPDSQLQTTDATQEDDFRSKFKDKLSHDHPLVVKELAEKELAHEGETSSESNVFKALTLLEFNNGVLLSTIMPQQYRTFAIDLMHKFKSLQQRLK